MSTKITKQTNLKIEHERINFKNLILENPNYFGNLADSKFKAVKPIVNNTSYEELTCVGFNPDSNLLEATLAIKLPAGYGGNLCQNGSIEYVRFFLNYGSGWEDAGVVAVNVHDIYNTMDCSKLPDKPLTYAVSLAIVPKSDYCGNPVMPKVHAILSWNVMPPAGPSYVTWSPVWGNSLDSHIQIKPRPVNLVDFTTKISAQLIQELKLPPDYKVKVPPEYETVKIVPIPIPDPPPLKLSDLVKLYGSLSEAHALLPKTAKLSDVKTMKVQSHRYGLSDIHTLISNGIDQNIISTKSAEWKSLGLDLQEAIVALNKTNANTNYEGIECLGLDYNLERLVATFRIKLPYGYSGNLCSAGSIEYVAFWADWDDTCNWTYLGTVPINVHDINNIAPEGLCYSAVLPVDLSAHRNNDCTKPKIGRVRAVLSWSVPPSTTNPDALNYWGNRLDAHVQIKPGKTVGATNPQIIVLGGIPVDKIDSISGMTTPTATFALTGLAPDSMGRACPFGGRVVIQGPPIPGLYYRVQVRKVGELSWSTLTATMVLVGWNPNPPGGVIYTTQVANNGFFQFLPFNQNIDNILAQWDTAGDDLWEVQLQIATAPNESALLPGVDMHRIQLDNTAPQVDIHIDSGGDCKKFKIGIVINGHFVATDDNFGSYSLGTSPFPGPVNPSGGIVETPPSPGSPWTLDTTTMGVCGYVLVITAVDRAILNSSSVGHWTSKSVGFCLDA